MNPRIVIFVVSLVPSMYTHAESPTKDSTVNCKGGGEELAALKKRYAEAISSVEASRKQITDEWNRQLTEASRQAERQAKLLEQADTMAKRQWLTLEKSAENQARFSKVLDRWQKQQEQYQSFLDSLKSPQPQ